MTTFKAKNVFLVLGRGHTMNKLTYEYKKMQKLKALVDLQCKCVRLDTLIKSILKFFENETLTSEGIKGVKTIISKNGDEISATIYLFQLQLSVSVPEL